MRGGRQGRIGIGVVGRAGEVLDAAGRAHVGVQVGDVQPVGVRDHAVAFGDRDLYEYLGERRSYRAVYGDAAALSGVSKFSARVKCAMLGWSALEDALVESDVLGDAGTHATQTTDAS